MKKLLALLLLLSLALLLGGCPAPPPQPPVTTTQEETAPETTAAELTMEETTTEEASEETAATTEATEGEPVINQNDIPQREQATPAEIGAEERRVKNLLASLDTGRIDKIVLVQTRPTADGARRFTYESTSKDAIKAWVDIFGAMRLSGAQFEFLSGGNLAVYVYSGGKRTEQGCLEGAYLTNGKLKTMCRIDNYSALYDDIKSAAAMVSGELIF